ncbi:MAG: anaerobic ribonucleoside-triphosphate reductase activating protein [Lachnospiraceae bacterium]
MNYHDITKDDMKNGDGLRVVLWVAGCSHGCFHCQNPVTWDPKGGLFFGEAEEQEIFRELDKSYISGITFSGGDPLHESNVEEITSFAKKIKERYPQKTLWLYTGSLWEEIQELAVLKYLDVLVDGKYIEAMHPGQHPWVGSSNQRVIDVPVSLELGRIVLHKVS